MNYRLLSVSAVFAFMVSVAFSQTVIKQRPSRPVGPDARGIMGGGRSVRVDDITPGSKLRGQLENLPPQARAAALQKLESFAFHKSDIASLRSDPKGGIYYVCVFTAGGEDGQEDAHTCTSGCAHSIEAAEAEDSTIVKEKDEPWVAQAAVPIDSPSIYYHSKPGSQNVLFLDFTGFVITNTRWNSSRGVTEWVARPYSTDADETTFSDAEQQDIFIIWQRVAEDYAPFDINVTTEQPPAWNSRTAHALVTPTTDANGVDLPHKGSGGIAYVDEFGGSSYSYDSANAYSPAFVLPFGVTANTAEAASHEIGHNMGLSHDGATDGATYTNEYYGGHAATASAPSWGPIMGTGYGRNVSQWSIGEYYDANQFQDDLTIIAGKTAYRPDDHGGTTATATELEADGLLQIGTNGIIETTGDVDMLRFVTGAGTVNLDVVTTRVASGTWGGNLDAALLLYDGNGILIASNNPPAEVNASISTNLAEGIYFAAVVPVGAGDPFNATPSGYTVYGSVGPYTFSGNVHAAGDNIFLVAPNGGEIWYRGTTNTISWSAGFAGNVDISLYKGAGLDSVIASGVANSGTYSWVISEEQSRGNDYRVRVAQSSNPTNFAESAGTFAIDAPPQVIALLDENFDASSDLPTGWTSTGTGTWTVVSTSYHTASNSAFENGPSTVAATYLTSPAVSIPVDAINLQFSFWHSYNLETGYDGGVLEFSIDGGAWFDMASGGSGLSVVQNGYTHTISSGFNSPIGGRDAWSGYSGGFIKTLIDFTDTAEYAGHSLRVRWLIASDSDTASAGWYIDTVTLTGALPAPSVGTLDVSPVDGLSFAGYFAGPFTPASQAYTLSNPGTNTISWTAAKVVDWISFSATSGTLAPDEATNVTVSINSNANTLLANTYSDNIVFSNTTSGEGDTARSVTLTVNPPDAPTGVLATPSIGQVDLSWAASTSATSYAVKRSTVSGSGYTLVGNPTETSFSDTTVTNGMIYYYVVSAVNAGGESLNSSEVAVTLLHVVPFVEDFETLSPGDLAGQNLWVASNAVVQAGVGVGGSQGLNLGTGTAQQTFANGTNTVTVNVYCKPVPGEEPAGVDGDASAVFWVDTNLYVRAYSNTTAVTLPAQIDTNTWTHFEIGIDYAARTWQLSVDGGAAISGLGLYSARTNFATIRFENTTEKPFYIDDISISTVLAALTDYEIWLDDYFGSSSYDGNLMSSNGVNTIREAYVAGLDPTNPTNLFAVTGIGNQTGSAVLNWSSGVSGRLYNVYWSSNLLGGAAGFQLLQSNIPWTVNSVTDTVHSADDAGFYRIEVQLE